MKMVYVENVRFPSERAHAIQILHTCQELCRLGVEVTLLTPDRYGRGRYADILSRGRILFSHILLPVLDALAISFIPRRLAYHIQHLSFIYACRRWKRGKEAHAWYTRSPYIVWALSRSWEAWILELHDTPHPLIWRLVRVRVKKYVVISNALKAWLLKEGVHPRDVVIAPDGWDPASLSLSSDREVVRRGLGWGSQEMIFIYTGGLFVWKGMDRLVAWWNERAPSRARLVILGGTKEDRARIAASITSPSIQLLDPVLPVDVSRFLQAADVGVLSSSPEHSLGRLYTSPLKLFEYLSVGLPVLASDVPSSREVLDESLAVFFTDAQSFYTGCAKIMQDAAWRQAASGFAKERSLSYTWAARAKKIRFLLDEMK